MSGSEMVVVVRKGKSKQVEMFYTCQADGCDTLTIAAERKATGRKLGGSFKYCKVHAAESRKRMVNMFAEKKAAREALRKATLASVDGRTVSRGGVLMAPARKGSTVANDLAKLLDKNGYIRIRKADVPAVCAELAYAGCNSGLVVVTG